MSWKRLEEIFARRLQDVFKTSWISLESVLKTSWRYLEDVFTRRLEDVLKTSWQDILITYDQDDYAGLNQDVLKTSSEDEDEWRLHQDECLLGLKRNQLLFGWLTYFYRAVCQQKYIWRNLMVSQYFRSVVKWVANWEQLWLW